MAEHSEQEQLRFTRDNIKKQLDKFENYYKTVGVDTLALDEQIIAELSLRLSKLEPCFEEYDKIQSRIEFLLTDDEPLAELQDRDTFERKFFEVVAKARVTINNFLAKKHKQIEPVLKNESRHEQIKLPIIRLPTFRGSYNQWLEFRDSFLALVHNNTDISDIQKFYYLKSALEGEASHIIQSITVSAANYQIAWDLLSERFENKRLIIHHHIKDIFEQPQVHKESHEKLRQLFDNVNKNLRAIESLGLKTNEWDTMIIYIISSKFDAVTRREWEYYDITGELPTLKDMNKFLKNKCEILQQLEVNKFDNNANSKFSRIKSKPYINSNTYAVTNHNQQSVNYSCVVCKGSHSVYKCHEFLNLSVNDRINKINRIGACVNCLRKNHLLKDCRSVSCYKCQNKHHTLLHLNVSQNTESRGVVTQGATSASTSNQTETLQASVFHTVERETSQVILSTALLLVYDKAGQAHTCRALLDSASQSTFITSDLCKKLKLTKSNSQSTVSGINQAKAKIDYSTNLKLSSKDGSFHTTVNTLVVPKITDGLPSVSFSSLSLPENIVLADPTYNTRGEIDILLGANIYWELMREQIVNLGENKPKLQLTQLGWIIGGNLKPNQQVNLCRTFISLETLNENIVKFWEVENCASNKPVLSESERFCEEHFKQSHERDEQGRFIVSIPFNEKLKNLGESREIALKRLYTIERKLSRDESLKNQYNLFMREYLELGHMSKCNESENQLACYLPHHPVVKADSLTTKVRVVFDASAKTTTGLSLNETQFVGPTIQNNLFSILLTFRLHTFVLSGDIAMMYRQILVQPEQRKFQRILWRFSPQAEVECFELNTVTYGTASAPYLATKCLEQVASDLETTYPHISYVIRNHTYMDDVLTGSDTVEGILNLQRDLYNTFSSAGFKLRKWQTNAKGLENHFQVADDKTNANIINLSENQTSKLLGIYWDSNLDLIKFSVAGKGVQTVVTKRSILSEVSQIFDPLGLLAPVIIRVKLLIQKLWQLQIGWDQEVPSNINQEWLNFKIQLQTIVDFDIPRHVTNTNVVSYELHGFADASERAYGACIYIRSKLKTNTYISKLLCAKSRVAPLKNINLPRLELCAAQLLANLYQTIVESLDISFTNTFLYTDSTITLCWIKGPPNKWKTFVANRVGEIQSLTNSKDWYHVKSADNPADLITRGLDMSDIINSKFWTDGPAWLGSDTSVWPVSNTNPIQPDANLLEEKPHVTLTITKNQFDIFSTYSSFLKLHRVTTYILRFYKNCKSSKQNRLIGPLTPEELHASFNLLIIHAQMECFPAEYNCLRKGNELPRNSKLLSLSVFMDDNKLLRVGGRIHESRLGYQKSHPVILPSKHILTNLYLTHEHNRLGHCGPQQLLATVREGYWPIQGRNLCKKIVKTCVRCFRANPKPMQQLMGNLPQVRVVQAPPFFNTGIDYAGPILIRNKTGRGSRLIKSYICLFICLATKAVHIELVSDLTTQAFIATLRRFISRRGNPKNLYSDNGLNFVGADREIQNLYAFLRSENQTIADHLSQHFISWHFIPPRSPNFGGMWEANIKTIKNHLRKIVGNAHLTFEELSTVLTQLESILNSRPLTPISNHKDDLDVITPAHFLIGRRLTSIADPNVQDIPVNRLSRFQYMQKLQQQFWARWSKEYLTELQHRYKWKYPRLDVHVGSMAIIKDDNLPPLQWMMGRVTAVHPGPDGLTRVVTVKTHSSEVKRGISKICILPFEGNLSD